MNQAFPLLRPLLHGIVIAALLAWAESLYAQNIDSGKKQFEVCIACHTLAPGDNGLGPSLAGVFGRKAGTAPGFRYSNAVRNAGNSGTVWDRAALERFLADPQQAIPGNRMPFSGIEDAKQRRDLIDYLQKVGGQ